MLKDAISLLKKHYPYRLGGIFIVNAPGLFSWIWNLVKPFMPARYVVSILHNLLIVQEDLRYLLSLIDTHRLIL